MSLLISLLIGLISIILPGFFLALALLKKTGMPMFEIAVIGFIFGLIFPPTMIWLESFLIPYIHAFTFSNALYNANVLVLTIIGIILSIQQGAISINSLSSLKLGPTGTRAQIKRDMEKDYRKRVANIRRTLAELNADMRIVREHERQEEEMVSMHREELQSMSGVGEEERKKIAEVHMGQEERLFEEHEQEERMLIQGTGPAPPSQKPFQLSYVWVILLVLMVIAFGTRMLSIVSSPTYFEFDPYYDMISTQYILTYGYQLLYDHAAWPSLINGTIHRLQPLIPYLEAYWYNLAAPAATAANTTLSGTSAGLSSPNTTLLSLVSGYYPPISAALLVFVVFMFLYHEYGEFEGLIGAGLATVMPLLITTFIAGEQLLEPWGIFALFFFYAAYLLAAKYPDEPRYAILAGIAFASNFLGAHYYTVTAGILSGYIILQGIINIFRGNDNKSFYKMNAIVIAVIVIFFIFYNAYSATLTERTPGILGIPIIIGFPLFSLIGIFVADILVRRLSQRPDVIRINSGDTARYAFLAIFALFLIVVTAILYSIVGYLIFVIPIIMLEAVAYPIIARQVLRKGSAKSTAALMFSVEAIMVLAAIAMVVVLLTPLGKSVFAYIQLSKKFTTPSSPLFMTVQEYAPTGINYDFGSGGFGLIGSSIGGISLIVWAVLIAFSVLVILAIYSRDSKASVLAFAAVWSVAVAGMIEVKYLPHFGVAYIIAIGAVFGELSILYSNRHSDKNSELIKKVLFYAGIVIVILAAIPTGFQLLSAASNPNCNTMGNNQLGAVLYCNQVPQYWLQATDWMKSNVGPYGPRILAWWDYGDWINWFGNSNAVIRGDNSVPQTDYNVAAHYVLTSRDGINTTSTQKFMDSVQAKYILFDSQLVPKWGALDFLACVDINQTSDSYAASQGAQFGLPYALGTSACELRHDPAYLYIPISQNINNYCTLPGNSSNVYLHGFVVVGSSPINTTYCVSISAINSGKPAYLLYSNGTKSNAIMAPAFYSATSVQGQPFITFLLLYAPNANGTITNAPSDFYNSTYYKGFFLGKLPGFTQVYPANFTGINFVNSTNNIVIYQSNNFTGTLPVVTQKPSYVHNNYTMPG